MEANICYTVDTYIGPVPKTTINGFPCFWRQDVVETMIPLLSNLTPDSVFLDCGSMESSMSYLASLFSNGSMIYSHNHWTASGWEADGYPLDEAVATFWDFYASVKKQGIQRKVVPIRGMVQYTLGIHDPASVDLAFISMNHLGIDYITLDVNTLITRMKPGGTIILVENFSNNPAFDKILQTVPNSAQITTPNTTTQLHRIIRFMSIKC